MITAILTRTVSALCLLTLTCCAHAPPQQLSGTEDVKYPLGPPVGVISSRSDDCGPQKPCAAPPAAALPSSPIASAPTQTPDLPDDLPTLDPDAPMPKESVSTNATLQLEQPAQAMVDARSDVFSSGEKLPVRNRGGVLPATITLVPGGGVITVSRVRGRIGCQHAANYGPDGGKCVGGNTNLLSAGAVSGIVAHERSLFLTGVFMGETSAPKPPVLDFSQSALGMTFDKLEPQLGQSFFIGDGLTGTGDGAQQRFIVPAGATRLYLGFADGSGFQGSPGTYDDNTGSVALRITQVR
jgi:hypothetical protein